MPSYKAPVTDTLFILNDVIGIDRYSNLPGFAGATPDMIEAVLSEGGRFCSEVIAPLNQVGDREGCTRHADGSVTTPTGFKDAFNQYVEAGWPLLSVPEEFGGQGLPHVINCVMEEYLNGANQAFAMYPGLTMGAFSAVLVKGSDELKAKYLPNMGACKWGGTMNLTEPH